MKSALSSPTKAVIDTGPLFTALTLNYVRKSHLPSFRKTCLLEAVKSDIGKDVIERTSRQEAYLMFFGKIRRPLTTSHVIGELQGLQSSRLSLRGEELRFFWLHNLEFLLTRQFDEMLIQVLLMNAKEEMRDTICSNGPADAGVIELARDENCPLLTFDRNLIGTARRAGVACYAIQDCGLF